jgi:hypothetical protein
MTNLADRIRDKLNVGLLPQVAGQRVSRGYGRGEPCSACGVAILPAQAQFELDAYVGSTTYRFHLGCYGLWQAECLRRGGRRKGAA